MVVVSHNIRKIARPPAPADPVSDQPQSWQSVLTSGHLRQIFTVLEAAQEALSGQPFKEALLGALGDVYGVSNVTFFFGPTYPEMFLDPNPLVLGIPDWVLREYQEQWVDKDIFTLPTARRLLSQHGFTTIEDLKGLPAPQREFVRKRLAPPGRGTASALHLRFADGEAIVGMYDEEKSWSAPDIVAMHLLAKHLRASCRAMAIGQKDTAADICPRLSPRQREVAELVSDGLTNAEIAAMLCVTEMTVKKYLSRIFATTGMTNRSQLAVAMLRSRR